MKTAIKPRPDFQPIELTITIETRREYRMFLTLFARGGETMKQFLNELEKQEPFTLEEVKDFMEVFQKLWEVELEENLKRK